MQALLLSAYEQLELADLPRPAPAPDEVLLRVAACGVCGSDVHGYDGGSGRRIPPIVMGHEAAGTIAEVGSALRDWAVGDRVTFDSTLFCGRCAFCLRGERNLCDSRQVFGVSCPDYRRDGAFAEFLAVPERVLYRLPDALPYEHAAMIEAVSVALHAIRVSGFQAGETALVLGAGMIGTLIVQALRAAGAGRIVAVDPDATRLALAERSGAHAVSTRAEMTGLDHVFEAVGIAETLAAAVGAVRKGGTVTLVGNIAAQAPFPLQAVVTRQIRMQGSAASAGEYPRAIDLLASGQIDVDPLLSAIAPLSEGAAYFRRLHAREPNLMKVVLTPQ